MWTYTARRILQALLILLGITMVTFALSFLVPADPVKMIAGRSATPEVVASIRHQLGLDQPVLIQYWHYLTSLLQGDMGRSYVQRADVTTLILSRLPATLLLLAGSIFFELLLGLPAGIYASVKRGKPIDKTVMIGSFLGVSAPQFVVGLIFIYLFAYQLGWFPLGGYGGLAHLFLPALTLGIAGAGFYSRMTRSSMVDVLRQDYIQTAHAKGLAGRRVVLVHALRNGILPIITMIGLDIGLFMQGAVVVETVFGWPGIGQLAWQAIQVVDIPVIMGVTLVAAIAVVLGNFVADIATTLLDPRVRLGR